MAIDRDDKCGPLRSHFGRIAAAIPLHPADATRPFKPKVAGSNLVGRMGWVSRAL